jgi:hypothetical protein
MYPYRKQKCNQSAGVKRLVDVVVAVKRLAVVMAASGTCVHLMVFVR